MPRADLHAALVLDRDIYEASRVDATLLDPVVRSWGGIPGVARPITVMRAYQGPQGYYAEHFVLTDPEGREVARSVKQRIRLSGEAFEDEFKTVLTGVHLRSADEHRVTFYLDDEEVASIPVFVETALGGDAGMAAEETFKKAVAKGSVVWLTVPQPPGGTRRKPTPTEHTQPVWFVAEGSTLYVFNGPTEQQVPNLTSAKEVKVTARSKDLRSKISHVKASVRIVPTDDPLWDKIATAGLGRRLNLPDGDGAKERWRANCTLVELTPHFGRAQAPRAAASAAAAAPASQAAAAPKAEGAPAPKKKAEDDIHVEAQIDQAVYDQLIAEGKSERIARAKAKAAYVRAEKARIRAEREGESAA